MIFRRIFAALGALALVWLLAALPLAPAHAACTAPCTKAQITTDITTNWPDNTAGEITPALLRSTVLELVNSYIDANGASSLPCLTHQWVAAIATLSSVTCSQPAIADISGWGTGVAAALGVNIGSAGAPVLFNGAGGTPSSITLTNATGLGGAAFGTQSANQVFAGPSTGSAANPAFRALVGADLPLPTASTLGGIESITSLAHNWVAYIDTSGVPHQSQPAASDLANISADNVLGNFTAGSAAPGAGALVNCSNALTYSTTTHTFGCNSSAGTGTVTSVTPGAGLASSTTAACSQTAITASGTLSAAECVDARTTTTETINDSDRAKLITASNASAQAYSIAQAGAASNFQSGWFTEIANIGAGVVTITPATSTINGASSLKLYPGERGKLVSDGTNYQLQYLVAINGPWHLLNTLTASNSVSLTDTTSITSAFTEYEIVLENILPATNNTTIELQMQVGGTFQSTSYLSTWIQGNGISVTTGSLTSGIVVGNPTNMVNTFSGVYARYLLSNPGQTLTCKLMYGDWNYQAGVSQINMGSGGGCYNGSSGAYTGIQVLAASGNLTSGVMKIYGRVN